MTAYVIDFAPHKPLNTFDGHVPVGATQSDTQSHMNINKYAQNLANKVNGFTTKINNSKDGTLHVVFNDKGASVGTYYIHKTK